MEDLTNNIIPIHNPAGFIEFTHPNVSKGDILLRGNVGKKSVYANASVRAIKAISKCVSGAISCSISSNRYLGKPLLFNFLETNVLFLRVKQRNRDYRDIVSDLSRVLSENCIPPHSFYSFDGDECAFVWQLDSPITFSEIGLYLKSQKILSDLTKDIGSSEFVLGNSDFLNIPGTINRKTNRFVFLGPIVRGEIAKSRIIKSILDSSSTTYDSELFALVYVGIRKLFDKRWLQYSFSPKDLDIALAWIPLLYGCLFNIYSGKRIQEEIKAFCCALSNGKWNDVKFFYQPIIDKLVKDSSQGVIFIGGVCHLIGSSEWLPRAIELLQIEQDEFDELELKQFQQLLNGDQLSRHPIEHTPALSIGVFNPKNYQEFFNSIGATT